MSYLLDTNIEPSATTLPSAAGQFMLNGHAQFRRVPDAWRTGKHA
jgi:hypothetical protein